MNLRPCLLAGIVIFTFAGDSVLHRLQAQDLRDSAAPMVLAQNDGFFGRIFNNPKDSSDSKPLFLNREGKGTGGGSPIIPYDLQAETASRRAVAKKGYEGESELDKRIRLQTQQALADGARAAAESAAAMERYAAQQARLYEREHGGGGGEAASTSKKMVYDPGKVWTYNPNKRRDETAPSDNQPRDDSNRRSRIYNTR